MKPRILNTDDNKLDPMKSVHDYAAGSEEDINPDDIKEEKEGSDESPINNQDYTEDKPFPDELANPEEQDEKDELPDNG